MPVLTRLAGVTCALACLGPDARAEEPAWRLSSALGAPRWLTLGLEQRTRFELLKDDFRATHAGDSTGVLLRTRLTAEATDGPFAAGLELIDSRAYATDETPLDTTIVDPLDVLQAYGRLTARDVATDGDQLTATLGRFTIDVGSRRLVARNDFRNTINAFEGADLQWTRADRGLRAFAVLPVRRLPTDPAELADNEPVLDRSNPNALLWGAFGQLAVATIQLEGYVLGLHERDGVDTPSTNRQLITPGARALRKPKAGHVDFQLEGMVQIGTSRGSAMDADTDDRSHRAASVHATLGYQHASAWQPRLAASYDYASGDGDPDDDTSGRFDPLFGARRFDFGPTSFFGAIARSNVHTPAGRAEIKPHARLDAFVAYHAIWLASARDAWVPARLRDPTGAAGTFVGQLVEARARWHAIPKRLVLEVDAAYLIRGEFAEQTANRTAPAAYVAAQVTATL